jgi:transcriptional regulator with XRE-family HTH domain
MSTSAISNQLEHFTNFGDLLKYLRHRAGLSQLELSIAVGDSGAQLSRFEHNRRIPISDLAALLALFVPVLKLKQSLRSLHDWWRWQRR